MHHWLFDFKLVDGAGSEGKDVNPTVCGIHSSDLGQYMIADFYSKFLPPLIASAGRARAWAGARKLGIASILSRDGVSGAVAERRTCLVVSSILSRGGASAVGSGGAARLSIVVVDLERVAPQFRACGSAVAAAPAVSLDWRALFLDLVRVFLDLVLRNSPRLLALLEQTAKVRRLAVLEQSADQLFVVDE